MGMKELKEVYKYPNEKPNLPFDEQGWFHLPNSVYMRQILTKNTKIIVELGSWHGNSARGMLCFAPNSEIICVDTWLGSPDELPNAPPIYFEKCKIVYEQFLTNCWEYRNRITPMRMTSVEGLRKIKEFGVEPDLIYIDASHTYANCKEDIRLSLELFPNAFICGDDFNWIEVQRAVTDYCKENNRELGIDCLNLGLPPTFWWLE